LKVLVKIKKYLDCLSSVLLKKIMYARMYMFFVFFYFFFFAFTFHFRLSCKYVRK